MIVRLAARTATLSPFANPARAAAYGLHTLADVDELDAEGGVGVVPWLPPGPRGLRYYCPFCDQDLTSRSGAFKHRRLRGHVVARVDYLEDEYLAWVAQQQRAREQRSGLAVLR